jgi:penicillin-binding protein 2
MDASNKLTTKLIPRLFHRRLALLGAAAISTCAILGARMARLTVVRGSDARALAESRLDQRDFISTVRGTIYDCKGEELAVDRASYALAVDYQVISGVWIDREARRAAQRKNAERWAEMSPEAREAAAARERPYFEHQVEELWDIISARGDIPRDDLDLKVRSIRDRIEKMAEVVWAKQAADEILLYGDDDAFQKLEIKEQTIPHTIIEDLPTEVAFDFKRLAADLPGLVVIDSQQRMYPWQSATVTLDRSTLPAPLRSEIPMDVEVRGIADHILGEMRDQIWASDLVERPKWRDLPDGSKELDLGWYEPEGDMIGARGLEKVYEQHLRGLRGVIDRRLDSGEVDRVEPAPGEDLRLTIDIKLQAKIQAILSPEFGLARVQQFHAGWDEGVPRDTGLPLGTPLNGAAVVIDVDKSEIVAMVSMPTIASAADLSEADRVRVAAAVNRAAETPYPPGSIIKPLVLAAAVSEGVHALDDHINCTGHYFPHWKERARCWIYREQYEFATHNDVNGGPLNAETALARSCNIYFYTLAEKLGAHRLVDWYRGFGMGERLDVGLTYETQATIEEEVGGQKVKRVVDITIGENPGTLPSDEHLAKSASAGTLTFETIIMGIGQGPLGWTPLQAANAYAILARGGYVRDAILLQNDPRASERRHDDLGLDPRAVNAALEGLRRSVMESYGTGHHIRYADGSEEPIINIPGAIVWAKTGTAQAPALEVDDDGDGKRDRLLRLDHSWFVGLVGSEGEARPRYAIAVILEYGGSGGRAAGPIANQIIKALFDEGYR